MFKKTILVCLALFLAVSVQAQSRFRFGFRFNPLISLSSVQDNNKSSIGNLDKGGRFAFSSGLMATYGLSENFGIYTGAMFALKGFKANLTHNPSTAGSSPRLVTHNANLTFLEIPLALHLTSSEVTTGMKIRGLFGLSANFLVGANTTRNEYIIDITNQSNVNLKDLRTNADLVLNPSAISSATNQPYGDLGKTKEKSGTQGYNIFVPDFIIGAGVDWTLEGIGSFDLGISYHGALGNITKYALRGNDRASVSYLSFDIGYFFQ